MTQTATKPQLETAPQPVDGEVSLKAMPLDDSREWQAEQLRLLWRRRRFFIRSVAVGLLVSTLVAFLIPKSYTSTTQLMPPDPQSTSGMAMMAAMAAKGDGGLAGVAGDLLGLKSSGALFIGVLRSQTSQDRLIQQFDLTKVYGVRLVMDARMRLDENTSISEDKKSGIITISVTDHDPQRAAALASAYVDQLNTLVSELSTSSAHRERVFLEERLKVAKQDLDNASNQLAQFSSKNNTLDIQQEGKAMLDAAGSVAGEMIAAQSQLEGLRQIYTDNNSRVRSLNARVAELRKQLEKLGGTQADGAKIAIRPLSSNPGIRPTAKAGGGLPYPTLRKSAAARSKVRRLLPPCENPGNCLRIAYRTVRTRQNARGKRNAQRQSPGSGQGPREEIVSSTPGDHVSRHFFGLRHVRGVGARSGALGRDRSARSAQGFRSGSERYAESADSMDAHKWSQSQRSRSGRSKGASSGRRVWAGQRFEG